MTACFNDWKRFCFALREIASGKNGCPLPSFEAQWRAQTVLSECFYTWPGHDGPQNRTIVFDPSSETKNEVEKARVRKRKEAEKAIKALRDALLKKYESQLPVPFPEDNSTKLDALFPAHLEEFLAEKESEQVAEA